MEIDDRAHGFCEQVSSLSGKCRDLKIRQDIKGDRSRGKVSSGEPCFRRINLPHMKSGKSLAVTGGDMMSHAAKAMHTSR